MNLRTNIRRITVLGMCAALTVALIMMLQFPIFPSAPFLKYDPGDIPIFLCTYLFGPQSGVIITIVASVIQGNTVSADGGLIGIIMHICATSIYAITAGLIYRKKQSIPRLIVATACGIAAMTLVMIPLNLIFTPLQTGAGVDVVIAMLPVIVLFNFIKSAVNGVIAAILYKSLYELLFKRFVQ